MNCTKIDIQACELIKLVYCTPKAQLHEEFTQWLQANALREREANECQHEWIADIDSGSPYARPHAACRKCGVRA